MRIEVEVVIEHQACPVYGQDLLEGVRSISVASVTAVVQQDATMDSSGWSTGVVCSLP